MGKRQMPRHGIPKNSTPFETSFKSSESPAGRRIPDHVVKFDEKGNHVKVNKISEAEFIMDSKLLGISLSLSQQLRGFIELASKTQQKVLVLLTDPGAS